MVNRKNNPKKAKIGSQQKWYVGLLTILVGVLVLIGYVLPSMLNFSNRIEYVGVLVCAVLFAVLCLVGGGLIFLKKKVSFGITFGLIATVVGFGLFGSFSRFNLFQSRLCNSQNEVCGSVTNELMMIFAIDLLIYTLGIGFGYFLYRKSDRK